VARSAQELQCHFASRDLRRGFVYRPRQIVDYSIVLLFLSTSRFMLIAHARDIGTYPASINPAVHFPPASNRILAGYFLDGVFCVHHSYFSRQFLAAFYQVVPVRFYCPFCTRSRYSSRTGYFDISQKRKMMHFDPSCLKFTLSMRKNFLIELYKIFTSFLASESDV